MRDLGDVRPSDAMAGRLLLQWERATLAAVSGVSAGAVRHFETERRNTTREVRRRLVTALAAAGVRFLAKGDVRLASGLIAPTRQAVGLLGGVRIKRAARALGLSPSTVQAAARLNTRAFNAIMRSPVPANLRPTLGLYRIVGVLQAAGYTFAPNGGDGLLGERPRPLTPPPKFRAAWRPPGWPTNHAQLEAELNGQGPEEA